MELKDYKMNTWVRIHSDIYQVKDFCSDSRAENPTPELFVTNPVDSVWLDDPDDIELWKPKVGEFVFWESSLREDSYTIWRYSVNMCKEDLYPVEAAVLLRTGELSK